MRDGSAPPLALVDQIIPELRPSRRTGQSFLSRRPEANARLSQSPETGPRRQRSSPGRRRFRNHARLRVPTTACTDTVTTSAACAVTAPPAGVFTDTPPTAVRKPESSALLFSTQAERSGSPTAASAAGARTAKERPGAPSRASVYGANKQTPKTAAIRATRLRAPSATLPTSATTAHGSELPAAAVPLVSAVTLRKLPRCCHLWRPPRPASRPANPG